MAKEKLVFETHASVQEVQQTINGKLVKFSDRYETSDPAEIAALSDTFGVKKASASSTAAEASADRDKGGK